MTDAGNVYSETVDTFTSSGTSERQFEDATQPDKQSVWNRWQKKRDTTLRQSKTRSIKYLTNVNNSLKAIPVKQSVWTQ